MSVNDGLNKVSRGVMDFLFPRKCPFCGKPVGRELLCEKCEEKLPYTQDRALRRGAGYGRCASPLFYEEGVRKAVLDYKFHGKLGGLNCFGSMLAQCAAEQYSGEFDAITWVPVSKKRLKKRGFDQSRFLAGSACVDWHVSPVETLKKVVDNPPQSGLTDAAARRANVLGVYEAVNAAEIAGKRWLLIDDVLTTGATLAECVRVLKEAGAQDVMCLTLAVVRKED
ncbi:MAG: ComF family protein [Clostridiales bacterium]|nr:ComF family protein [Candidatus Cacconaster stercorequi]